MDEGKDHPLMNQVTYTFFLLLSTLSMCASQYFSLSLGSSMFLLMMCPTASSINDIAAGARGISHLCQF